MTTGEIFLDVLIAMLVFCLVVAALDWLMDQDGGDR